MVTEKILELLGRLGYAKKDYGYTRTTENITHWVTLFSGEELQAFGYPKGDPSEENVYSTGVINVSARDLKKLLSIFLSNHS